MVSRRHRSISLFREKIPLDIVVNILHFLSVTDQVCFSLSCKYLYTTFLIFLDVHDEQLPKLLPLEKRPVLCYNSDIEHRPRIQLLRRLQDSRWEYCGYCWILHRRHTWCSKFLGLPLIRRFSSNSIDSKLQLGHEPRLSVAHAHAGEVDLCPCLTITSPDKLHIIRTINSLRGRSHGTREYYYNNILYRAVAGQTRNILAHDCEVLTGDPSIKL